MQPTPRLYASQVRKGAETLGVPLPPALVEQLDHADNLTHTAETMLRGAGDLNEAVLDAIEAGRAFHTDKAVQRLVIERMLANQGHGIADAARRRSMQQQRATLVEFADVVLDEWADALSEHSAALTIAATELGVDNLDDVRSVITRGPAAVQQWSDAQRATTMWAAAVQGFTGFADAARIDYSGHKALIFADADAAGLTAVRQTARRLDAWNLARHGLPLELATLDEFRARVERHEGAADDYEQEFELADNRIG
ncbi:hypothetical protein [Mycolicibacterium chlorophenolicum]|uniref:Uncharacterized protein n=1 Tax=Mycolicibacterium chlorophenolicum TaxID=37916 RepID=A0A0J6WG96_9MYCO|nr:hypothetical protein [Mycolicibacterium chlorophenolicum]KMO82300.1 hypothetical protein MCHLDSM_01452 [Mycolicibacterium chlorophenolicum]